MHTQQAALAIRGPGLADLPGFSLHCSLGDHLAGRQALKGAPLKACVRFNSSLGLNQCPTPWQRACGHPIHPPVHLLSPSRAWGYGGHTCYEGVWGAQDRWLVGAASPGLPCPGSHVSLSGWPLWLLHKTPLPLPPTKLSF